VGFNILYNVGGDVNANAASIVVYINYFAKGFVEKPLQIDLDALTQVAAALQRPDFPHVDGIDKASPFKKAANFFVWFVSLKPIISAFPAETIGDDLNGIANHQNVMFAWDFAVSCLEGAKMYKSDGAVAELKNRIQVSHHFYRDMVEAFAAATHVHHFKVASLLFEQLAYKANPGVSYEEVI
jgi:hypothetical protein